MVLSSSPAKAQSSLEYDARLCAAGIVVLSADIRSLDSARLSEHERNWLNQRIDGQSGTLSWLCLRHASLNNINKNPVRRKFEILRSNISDQNWQEVSQIITDLGKIFPLHLATFKTENLSNEALKETANIYLKYCNGCHVNSRPEQDPPIYSLVSMAKTLPPTEFLARMIMGVHGTSEIALRNPLTDTDISGIYHYLLLTAVASDSQN
ncbi:MAG: hypothetical protein ACI845_003566 [Gammaproteobacteria bacterium]